MSIVSRLVLTNFFRILSLCCGAFIGIYLLVDFFEKVDRFIDYGAGINDYLTYLGHSIPFIFVQILPLAILTSMVLTLGGLGRTNEMTALRACGISLARIIRPLLVIIVLLCCLQLLVHEYLVPWNMRVLSELVDIKLRGREQIRLTHSKIWYRSDNKIINIDLVQSREQKLRGVTIFEIDDGATIVRRIDAGEAQLQDQQWLAPIVLERSFDPQSGILQHTRRLENHPLAIDHLIDDFTRVENLNAELGARQLAQLAARLEQQGYDASRQRVDLQARLATPFTGLVMGLLGIPFALQPGRQSNMALGVGLSLAIGAAYFIIQSAVISFGYAGALPPLVAAWTANLIFTMLAIWLFLGVKQ
ncbi:MAG: LPS export ABC transporter permease LptG [Desulfuromonadales bacterium]|nr:LPS export ABC transporter permease LptG [Desulfuromonadales bacterium]